MPRLKTKEVFTFDELSDDAKENARQWYREGALDYDWYDSVYEDAERVANILGIEFDQKQVSLMNGTSRTDPKIWFSGFASQGDGACFEGSYSYAKGSSKRIGEYAPFDETLHEIANNLAKAQKPYFYQLRATCSHRGHYYHSGCMSVDVEHSEDPYRDVPESDIVDELRRFADWIYGKLQDQYDYIMSDASVDETIRANDYEFDADGGIA